MPGMMCIVTNGRESPAGGEVFVSPFSDEGIEAWRGGMAHLESQHWKWPSWHSKPGFKLQSLCYFPLAWDPLLRTASRTPGPFVKKKKPNVPQVVPWKLDFFFVS